MKRVLLGAIAYLLLAGTIAGGWYWWEHRPGPFPVDGGANFGGGQGIDPGHDYTWGTVTLQNLGKKPLVVERVRLLRATSNLVYRGLGTHRIGLDLPEGEGQVILGEEGLWAPGYVVRSLREQHTVAVPHKFAADGSPEEGLQIIFGIRIDEPGIAGVGDVEVKMRMGHRRHTQVFHHSLYLCAPRSAFNQGSIPNCPGQEIEDKPIPLRTLG